MSEIADDVRFIESVQRRQAAGQIVQVRPPSDRACSTCPWRLSNQADPPDRPDATPDLYYTAEAREAMWEENGPGRGTRDGCRFGCHRGTTPIDGKVCSGADGILQRQLLRWWIAGRSASDYHGLSGPAAVVQIVAALAGRFVATGREDGRPYVEADGVGLYRDGDQVVVTLDGVPLDLETVARFAHPGVLDPDLGTEQVSPLGERERTELVALAVGADWASGPSATGVGVGIGGG